MVLCNPACLPVLCMNPSQQYSLISMCSKDKWPENLFPEPVCGWAKPCPLCSSLSP